MVWAGIGVGGLTDLHVFEKGYINARMYRNNVILPIVQQYAVAIGAGFILMDDNTPIHHAKLLQQCVDDEGIERKD